MSLINSDLPVCILLNDSTMVEGGGRVSEIAAYVRRNEPGFLFIDDRNIEEFYTSMLPTELGMPQGLGPAPTAFTSIIEKIALHTARVLLNDKRNVILDITTSTLEEGDKLSYFLGSLPEYKVISVNITGPEAIPLAEAPFGSSKYDITPDIRKLGVAGCAESILSLLSENRIESVTASRMQNLQYFVDEVGNKEIFEVIRKGVRTYNIPLFGYWINKPFSVFAKSGEEIVGGINGNIVGYYARIEWAWVDESYRMRGVGSTLLEKTIKHAKDNNCKFVQLDTFNDGARLFCEKNGFECVGTIPKWYYGRDCHFMRKAIL